jgi:glucan phosphoethanolaminetransferase (alkaline phosphatase superfamily)
MAVPHLRYDDIVSRTEQKKPWLLPVGYGISLNNTFRRFVVDAFFHYLSTHPIAALVVAVIILFMTYFVINKLLKVALILGLVLIGVVGYFYYQAPEKFPDNVKSTINEVKEQSDKITEHGRNVVTVGKEVLDKGKKLAETVEKKVKEDEKVIEEK